MYNADGTITGYDACDDTTGKGTWEVKDNTLIEKSSSFIPVESEIKELTDDKLITVLDFMYKQEFTYKPTSLAQTINPKSLIISLDIKENSYLSSYSYFTF